MNLHQLQVCKQTHTVGRCEHFVPVEGVVRSVHLAVQIALLLGGGTQFVQRFHAQQVFFAVDDIKRLQLVGGRYVFDVLDGHDEKPVRALGKTI